MTEEKRRQILNWVRKAEHDLEAARRLMADPPLLDTAVYHCQQAVEKAIKGFLTRHDIVFEQTQDLRLLLELAVPVETRFDAWRATAIALSPYGVRFLYPAAVMEPSQQEAERVLQDTEAFTTFVLGLLADVTAGP